LSLLHALSGDCDLSEGFKALGSISIGTIVRALDAITVHRTRLACQVGS
jgi:hypothetical protein